MAYTRYVTVSAVSEGGKAFISTSVFSEIATCVLQDMPNVSFEQKKDAKSSDGINVLVLKPVSCSAQEGVPTVRISILVRKDENAGLLAEKIQHEIREQLLSSTEIANCVVNVHIDGIFR
jgi:uncharacterized alkaline shock family protein YloU